MLVRWLIMGALEMELKKLHMGTISYSFETMDEVSHQLALAFGANVDTGNSYKSPDNSES